MPERLDQIPGDEEIGIVTGDDTRRGPIAIIEPRATALAGRSVHWKARGFSSLPIRRNGRPWKDDGPAALDIVLGPMAFQWLTPDRPAAEIHIRVALMNRVNALGTAESVRVA